MDSWITRQRRRLHWTVRPSRHIPATTYDAQAGRWTASTVTAGDHRDELILATYNIWFADTHARERYQAIADLLAEHTPDIIAFQEVTPEAVTEFQADPWIQTHYYCAAAAGEDFGDFGLMLLSRLPLIRVAYTHLPASFGRGQLRAQVTVNNQILNICAVHLESGKAASRLRARQTKRIFATFDGADDVVVLGDFNMPDGENAPIPSSYIDTWAALRRDKDGFTEDTHANPMLADDKGKTRRVRFDRILIKSENWVPTAIELLGTHPISTDLPRVFPSDHFGLLCRVGRAAAAH